MPDLTLTSIAKSFGDHMVIEDLDLHVRDGELFTLLGPSGCGKSTTLWSIAGLHTPDRGSITFGDRVMFDAGRVDVPPVQRNCGVVVQSYAVWPHMTVHDNVAYPLKRRKLPRRQRADRVQEVLELVELDQFASRYPHELSGGQQQRVALARALAHPPTLMLLDEPFSNLDAKLRERARDWLRELQQRVQVTTVFVTHDQDEALSMSDRVVVMDRGRIRQIGTPEEVYQQPTDPFVADFVGTANLIPATAERGTADVSILRIDGVADAIIAEGRVAASGPVRLAVRPERIRVGTLDEPLGGPNVLTVKVRSVAYLGDHYRYVVEIGSSELVVHSVSPIGDTDELTIGLPPDAITVFPPQARDLAD